MVAFAAAALELLVEVLGRVVDANGPAPRDADR